MILNTEEILNDNDFEQETHSIQTPTKTKLIDKDYMST